MTVKEKTNQLRWLRQSDKKSCMVMKSSVCLLNGCELFMDRGLAGEKGGYGYQHGSEGHPQIRGVQGVAVDS